MVGCTVGLPILDLGIFVKLRNLIPEGDLDGWANKDDFEVHHREPGWWVPTNGLLMILALESAGQAWPTRHPPSVNVFDLPATTGREFCVAGLSTTLTAEHFWPGTT